MCKFSTVISSLENRRWLSTSGNTELLFSEAVWLHKICTYGQILTGIGQTSISPIKECIYVDLGVSPQSTIYPDNLQKTLG